MEILDEDMQMVRDFLKQWGAPFHITEHFENLVSEHAKEAGWVDDLGIEIKELRDKVADYDEIVAERDRLQEEVDGIESGQKSALLTVKYWLHDALYLNRPMQILPREILRRVEEAL